MTPVTTESARSMREMARHEVTNVTGGSKLVWENVGPDPYVALAKKTERESNLREVARGVEPKPARSEKQLVHPPTGLFSKLQTDTKKDGTLLDKETISAYEQQTAEFLSLCEQTYAVEITANDLRQYKSARRGTCLPSLYTT